MLRVSGAIRIPRESGRAQRAIQSGTIVTAGRWGDPSGVGGEITVTARAGIVVGFLLLAVVPTAIAMPYGRVAGALDLRTAGGVSLAGDLRVVAEGGKGFTSDAAGVGTMLLRDVTGRFTVWEQDRVMSRVGGVKYYEAVEDATSESVDVAGATVWARLDREQYQLALESTGVARVFVKEAFRGVGVPTRLVTEVETLVPTDRSLVDWGDEVFPSWQPGWGAVGANFTGVPETFPTFDSPRFFFDGEIALTLHGGTVRVEQDGAPSRSLRLLSASGNGDGGFPRPQTWRWVTFRGTIGSGEAPSGGTWLIGAPDLSFEFDGDGLVEWVAATGWAILKDEARWVANVDVTLVGGRMTLDSPASTLAPGVPSDSYATRGEWAEVRIGGARITASQDGAIGALAAAGAFTALLALISDGVRTALFRYALVAYTRIHRSNVLDHPRRARIMELVKMEPGIHLKELNRRTGGGWGAFRMHLRVLDEAGLVRIEHSGKFATVHLGGGPPPRLRESVFTMNPRGQQVYEAVPPDGSPMELLVLRGVLGMSRQLLNHHIARLRGAGLIEIGGEPSRRTAQRTSFSTKSFE